MSLKAVLVLTPKFCASRLLALPPGEGWIEVGKAACTQLEPALWSAFRKLAPVQAALSPGEAELELTPRFDTINVIHPKHYTRSLELLVVVEWTVKDKSGKKVWVQTVQGSAEHSIGLYASQEDQKLLAQDAVQDLADKSAREIAASPEIRKLIQQQPATQSAALPAQTSTPAPPDSTPAKVLLTEGTDVYLVFGQDLSSKTAIDGNPVSFVLSEDLKVGNVVVAKAGSKAVGEVTNATKSKRMGKGGELNIRIEYLNVGNVRVHLRGTREGGAGDSISGGIILVPFANLLVMMKHGKETNIKKGTALHAYVAEDISLPPVM
jgi:hypothetical protein